MDKTEKGLEVLRSLLRRMRDDDQGGYDDVDRRGKFSGFISRSLPYATPEELDALFELAGIVPDPIKVNGSCRSCVYGDSRGGDLGWANPCCSCSRPKMTNFVPLASVTKKQLDISELQAQLLENAKIPGIWWATGIVDGEHGSPVWNETFERARRAFTALKSRNMISDSPIGGTRVTNKGQAALKRHRSTKAA